MLLTRRVAAGAVAARAVTPQRAWLGRPARPAAEEPQAQADEGARARAGPQVREELLLEEAGLVAWAVWPLAAVALLGRVELVVQPVVEVVLEELRVAQGTQSRSAPTALARRATPLELESKPT